LFLVLFARKVPHLRGLANDFCQSVSAKKKAPPVVGRRFHPGILLISLPGKYLFGFSHFAKENYYLRG
jgi:hypothetical protein